MLAYEVTHFGEYLIDSQSKPSLDTSDKLKVIVSTFNILFNDLDPISKQYIINGIIRQSHFKPKLP